MSTKCTSIKCGNNVDGWCQDDKIQAYCITSKEIELRDVREELQYARANLSHMTAWKDGLNRTAIKLLKERDSAIEELNKLRGLT